MSGLLWVVALAGLGLVVMVLEVFVPSGGVLGFLSLLAIVAAVATAFFELGVTAGVIVTGVVVVAVPAVLALAFRWFPETPLGRRVLPPPPDPLEMLPDAPTRLRLKELPAARRPATSRPTRRAACCCLQTIRAARWRRFRSPPTARSPPSPRS